MEQDQRICPRCGQPAGEYRFCASCRSQIAGPRAEDTTHPATQALREVLRLEEALAAASKGISDRIAARSTGTAVQVEQDPAPVSDGNAGVLEIPTLQTGADERVGDVPAPPRAVARLEDVLTVAPRERATAGAASTPQPAPVAAEPVAPAPVAAESVAPPAPAPAERKGFWFDYVPAPAPAPAEPKGFWFEYVPAADAADDDAGSTDVTPELEPAAVVEPAAAAEPEPVMAEVPASTPRNHWLTVLCLLALVGLVMALTGRNPRRAA